MILVKVGDILPIFFVDENEKYFGGHISVVVVVNVRYVTNDLQNVFPSSHFAHLLFFTSSSIETCSVFSSAR